MMPRAPMLTVTLPVPVLKRNGAVLCALRFIPATQLKQPSHQGQHKLSDGLGITHNNAGAA